MTLVPKTARRQSRSAGGRVGPDSFELEVHFWDETSGRRLGMFGGRWDPELHCYTGDAAKTLNLAFHPGQLDAVEAFVDWLRGYLRGDVPPSEKIYDMIMAGGRRGGKSATLFACVVAFALAVPSANIVILVPSESFLAEPIAYLQSIMPEEWYYQLNAPHWSFTLHNGSTIRIVPGHSPRLMKQGRVDLIAINEGQSIPVQSYTHASAGIVDSGGIILTAANPPDVGDVGEWVVDLAMGAERGSLPNARFFFFDPENNPHIDQHALRAMALKMDQHTYDVQIRGMFLNRPDTVLHTWDRRENERPMPQLGDCTREFLKYYEGWALTDIGAVDVQNFPWIAATRFRAFRDHLAPDDMDKALLWGIGEAFIDQGDEIQCARQLKSDGCDPGSTLMVMDASCDWQQMERQEGKQRDRFKGAGSMDMFRAEGFRYVVPPDRQMESNPNVSDRVRAANARICSASKVRRVFVDPSRCPRTVDSIRKWKTKPDGTPSRKSRFAHAGDVVSYAVWRFFPRRSDKTEINVETIKRFAGRDRVRGY